MRKSLVLICLSLAFALVGRAEKTSVFFVHGANVGEQDARAWASEMFKRLWQAGANMEFCPVARESDIGPSYNYFCSSGDEVLELYAGAHNPAWYNGVSPSGNWGDRYSWHKQEIWKGRKSLLGFMGTTDWSGWGFRTKALGLAKVWSESEANVVVDFSVFKTNTVFCLYPPSITNAANPRLVIDAHLAQGIPALSLPMGRSDLTQYGLPSFDMNSAEFMPNGWPRTKLGDELSLRWLHSDVKNVAYYYTHVLFRKIVEIGGLR